MTDREIYKDTAKIRIGQTFCSFLFKCVDGRENLHRQQQRERDPGHSLSVIFFHHYHLIRRASASAFSKRAFPPLKCRPV